MDYSQYENYGFDRVSAFNLSTGYEARRYQAHWHSYGEILLVGPGKTNIFRVNQSTYELVEGDWTVEFPLSLISDEACIEEIRSAQGSAAEEEKDYLVPRPEIYTFNAWPVTEDGYADLQAFLRDRVENRQVYLVKGTVQEVLSEEEVAESDAELITERDVDTEVLQEASEVINPDAAEIENMVSVSEILDSEIPASVSVEESRALLSQGADEVSFNSDDWKLVLVNKQHPIPDDYEFELGTISGSMKCDERVISPLFDMLRAAKDDGVNLIVCSPYRDIDRQTMLFGNKVDSYMDGGMSYMDAYNLASQAVTVPGSSEHQIGLAIDIISDNYSNLDEGFGNTPAGKWLHDNSYKYGFIFRLSRCSSKPS